MNLAADINHFYVAIIEHDDNQDSMLVWMYPEFSKTLQKFCIDRSLAEGRENPFIFTKFNADWVYIFSSSVDKDVPTVQSASICIATREFHPEKFSAMLPILMEQYRKASGDPVKVLEGILSIYATGNYSNAAGSFSMNNFASTDAIVASTTAMKELYQSLGMDFIILWNSLLLRKRILVVANKVPKLLSVIRCLPLLAWHRQDWSILRPIIGDEAECMEDIRTSGVYIGGTVDPMLASKTDDFDVIYNIDSAHVEVLAHAVVDMKMCSVHKETIALIDEVASQGGTSEDITKAIARKTASIISQLRSIVPEGGKLTESIIREKVSNEATMRWLVRLSSAEGIL
jgi:hypothetical protein